MNESEKWKEKKPSFLTDLEQLNNKYLKQKQDQSKKLKVQNLNKIEPKSRRTFIS